MGKHHASEYENAIELQRTRARQSWECHSCGRAINPGQYYYRQSLGLIRKPPGVRLNAFCLDCMHSPLAERLDKGNVDMGNGHTATGQATPKP